MNGLGGIGIRQDDVAYTLEARATPQSIMNAAEIAVAPCLNASQWKRNDQWIRNWADVTAAEYERTSIVRRLTPRECERLQGFPDDWTLIPYKNKMAPDSPRYKACGNSMAVPVMRWIGQRIALVNALESNQ